MSGERTRGNGATDRSVADDRGGRRSPDGGREDVGPTKGDALELAREEAHRTLDAQLSTFDDIDAKASSIFQLNVAVVGVLLSALSIGVASGVDATALVVTPLTGVSVALFVLSAAAAGLTYTAVGQYVGAGPGDLLAASRRSEAEYRTHLVESYADWIRENERSNGRKAILVTVSLLGTVAGVLVLGLGVLAELIGDLLLPTVATVVALLVLGLLADLHGQFGRLLAGPPESGTIAVESLEESMAGQRTFKGRDRER